MLKKKKSFGALAVGGVIVVFWKDSNSPHVSLRISWHCRMFLTLHSVIRGVCVWVWWCVENKEATDPRRRPRLRRENSVLGMNEGASHVPSVSHASHKRVCGATARPLLS